MSEGVDVDDDDEAGEAVLHENEGDAEDVEDRVEEGDELDDVNMLITFLTKFFGPFDFFFACLDANCCC